jgi:hypothetical protein
MTVEELVEFMRVTQVRSEQLEAIMVRLHDVTVTQSALIRQHQDRIAILEAMLFPQDRNQTIN